MEMLVLPTWRTNSLQIPLCFWRWDGNQFIYFLCLFALINPPPEIPFKIISWNGLAADSSTSTKTLSWLPYRHYESKLTKYEWRTHTSIPAATTPRCLRTAMWISLFSIQIDTTSTVKLNLVKDQWNHHHSNLTSKLSHIIYNTGVSQGMKHSDINIHFVFFIIS